MYIDTHFHLFLDYDKFSFDVDEVVKGSIDAGVEHMWLASTGKDDIEKNLEFCRKYPNNLKTWVGFHPEDWGEYDRKFLDKLLNQKFEFLNSKQIRNSKETNNKQFRTSNFNISISDFPIVGIGEIGIDLSDSVIADKNKKEVTKKQQEVFEDQINLALRYDLPIAIHSRDAYKETLEILEMFPSLKFVWHCYNLKKSQTEVLLSNFKNIYFGFNAIITYKSGDYVSESIKVIPNKKILTETDAPFLAPRNKYFNKKGYNTPEGVVGVYEKLD